MTFIFINLQGHFTLKLILHTCLMVWCLSDEQMWCVVAMRHHCQSAPTVGLMETKAAVIRMTSSLFVKVRIGPSHRLHHVYNATHIRYTVYILHSHMNQTAFSHYKNVPSAEMATVQTYSLCAVTYDESAFHCSIMMAPMLCSKKLDMTQETILWTILLGSFFQLYIL